MKYYSSFPPKYLSRALPMCVILFDQSFIDQILLLVLTGIRSNASAIRHFTALRVLLVECTFAAHLGQHWSKYSNYRNNNEPILESLIKTLQLPFIRWCLYRVTALQSMYCRTCISKVECNRVRTLKWQLINVGAPYCWSPQHFWFELALFCVFLSF